MDGVLLQTSDNYVKVYREAYMETIMKEQILTACEGKEWEIRCPTMTIIQVLGASYGRSSRCHLMEQKRKKERRKLSINKNVIQQVVNGSSNCKQFRNKFLDQAIKTASYCNNHRFCSLVVGNFSYQPKDEDCPFYNQTSAYLQVNYKCKIVQTELRSKNTCSGEIPRLRCPQHRAKWERHVVQLYNFTLKHDLMCDELMLSHPTMSYCNRTQEYLMSMASETCFNKTSCRLRLPRDTCNNSMIINYLCLPQRLVTKRNTDQIFRYIEEKSIKERIAPETTTVSTIPPIKGMLLLSFCYY